MRPSSPGVKPVATAGDESSERVYPAITARGSLGVKPVAAAEDEGSERVYPAITARGVGSPR